MSDEHGGEERARPFRADTGLAHGAVSSETTYAALAFLMSLSPDAFTKVAPSSKRKSRLRYGGFPGSARRLFTGPASGTTIPARLKAVGEEALEAARLAVPDAPWDAFSLDTLVVNHYLPGEQVRPHKDPPRWEPLVLGVTLCEVRDAVSVMQFAVGDDKHRIVTPHRSAYVFHGRAYTDATHARLPSKRQRGAVWSLTFRANLAGAAAE